MVRWRMERHSAGGELHPSSSMAAEGLQSRWKGADLFIDCQAGADDEVPGPSPYELESAKMSRRRGERRSVVGSYRYIRCMKVGYYSIRV